jgi:hypothetical protein
MVQQREAFGEKGIAFSCYQARKKVLRLSIAQLHRLLSVKRAPFMLFSFIT